jgi:hypothetical protein
MKQALGLAVSGTEVRLAHLISHKGQIRIEGLERAKLQTTLEHQPSNGQKTQYAGSETKDAFDLKDSSGEKENGESAGNKDVANLEILYRLLEKYTHKRVKIAFNIPLSMVSYQRQDGPFATAAQGLAERVGGTDKEAGPILGHEVLKSKDGSDIGLLYEKHPSTMSLLREVNGFVRGNLYLALMDTTEVALANLARSSSELEPDKVTAIVYIEEDFSRLIFLRGQDLLHVSSIIHENAASPDILEVIYRKLLYEQDEAQIPEITCILLAGKSSRINAGDFFASRFDRAIVRHLSSKQLGHFPANEAQRQTFSEFAVPIALAWKILEPKNPVFIPLNLLPQELLDQQQVLKLGYQGYILLAITGLAAFFFTWQILRIRGDIGAMRSSNSQLEQQILNNQSTVDQVLGLEDQCKRLSKNLALSDSLSKGHDQFLAFLQKLNASVEKTGDLWVDEILKQKDGFTVKGAALNREKIPILAEKLEQASLRKVTRTEAGNRKLFSFELERFSAPDNVQFSPQGISIIDAAQFNRGGNLVLTKEGIQRPADGSVTPRTAAESPESLRQQRASPERETEDRAAANRGRVASNSVARQVSPEQPIAGESRFGEDGERIPARRKPDWQTQPDRLRVEPKVSTTPAIDVASPQDDGRQFADAVPIINGAVPASQKMTGIFEAGGINHSGKDHNEPQESRAMLSRSDESKPVGAPPEIYQGYTIEAMTSFTKDLAEQFAAAYRKRGFNAAVEYYHDERSGTKRYRVLVGIFATRPAAEKKAEQMTSLLMKDYRIVGLK